MKLYGPRCTCSKITKKTLPHNRECPRYDENRKWSKEDRVECIKEGYLSND